MSVKLKRIQDIEGVKASMKSIFLTLMLTITVVGCKNDYDKCIEAKAKTEMYKQGGSLLDSDEYKKRRIENIIEISGDDFAEQCIKAK